MDLKLSASEILDSCRQDGRWWNEGKNTGSVCLFDLQFSWNLLAIEWIFITRFLKKSFCN